MEEIELQVNKPPNVPRSVPFKNRLSATWKLMDKCTGLEVLDHGRNQETEKKNILKEERCVVTTMRILEAIRSVL